MVAVLTSAASERTPTVLRGLTERVGLGGWQVMNLCVWAGRGDDALRILALAREEGCSPLNEPACTALIKMFVHTGQPPWSPSPALCVARPFVVVYAGEVMHA